MAGNKPSTAADRTDRDDAPDLSIPEYQAKFATGAGSAGTSEVRSAESAHRLPPLRGFGRIRASGPGYNARVEEALRKGFMAAKAPKRRAVP